MPKDVSAGRAHGVLIVKKLNKCTLSNFNLFLDKQRNISMHVAVFMKYTLLLFFNTAIWLGEKKIVFQLDELGRLVCNVCNIVPGGIICFFPSYDYEKLVHSHLNDSGVLTKLSTKKKVNVK